MPASQPQSEAYSSEADELLYGGAAGGGKTDLLLGLAFNCHQRSIFIRRSYPELEDIKVRALEMGDPQHYKRGRSTWEIPPDILIRLRHLEKPGSETRYQGHAYDGTFFDELTHQTLYRYLYMFSRNRTVVPGQRCRIYSATNPGNEGNAWVIERWAPWLDSSYPQPALPGELRWYCQDGSRSIPVEGPGTYRFGTEDLIAKSRTFIPASLDDNPYLGDDYRANLQTLMEPLRSQLLYGDWSAGAQEDAYQVIPRSWLRMAVDRWREWDEAGGELIGPGSLGIDVGRGGDVSVLAHRRGRVILPLVISAVKDTMTVTGLAVHELRQMPRPGRRAVVDVIGIGAGVNDRLAEQAETMEVYSEDVLWHVVSFNAGAPPTGTDRTGKLHFANRRAEGWWGLRDRLDPQWNPTLCIPPDELLFAELTAPRWKPTSSGRIIVESKAEVKRKLMGRSTDRADAVVMACDEVDSEVLLGWG